MWMEQRSLWRQSPQQSACRRAASSWRLQQSTCHRQNWCGDLVSRSRFWHGPIHVTDLTWRVAAVEGAPNIAKLWGNSALAPTEPRPREAARKTSRWQPIVLSRYELPAPSVVSETSFLQVVDARRSERRSQQLPREDLAELLWHAARVRETGTARLGLPWQHRAAPSAGGIHPIELFVRNCGSDEISLYDPVGHALLSLGPIASESLICLDEQVAAAAPEAHGTILALIADTNRTEAAYECAESLVWRDAGAFMMTLHLVAEYLQLAFCPIGVLGNAIIDALRLPDGWLPVGTCIVGRRVSEV